MLFSFQNLRTRLAPTPSGYLHIGNAYSFLLTWLIAQKNNGTILLRIDDLDTARIRNAYVEDIFQSLAWLGITWEEGPQSVTAFEKSYSQRYRFKTYQQYLQQLKENTSVFYCHCSRKTVRAQSTDGQYPMSCRGVIQAPKTRNCAIRLLTPKRMEIAVADVAQPKTFSLFDEMRDFVVWRKEDIPAYQLASLVDDISFDINFVVRGSDLWLSSAAQTYLAQQLEDPILNTLQFYHHPLFTDEKGHKLSKSEGATSLKYLRERGELVTAVYQKVATALSLPRSASKSLKNLSEAFNEAY